MSGFTGVKPAQFDAMTSAHTQAARRLEQLAQALHRELHAAGLDTTPATRLRDLATRVATQAGDLRRRQRLVHELQRQKVTFGTSTPAGSFVELPDTLDAAQALLDGTLAARAARRAADGDTRALAELRAYASRTADAAFVKTFLGVLGAEGVTRLPGSLAAQLRDARDRQATTPLTTTAPHVLSLLATALAKATDPRDPAYLGSTFLKDLTQQGRATHRTGDTTYTGYQAQALIWRAHDGRTPFSREFMTVVGRDAIAYEHDQRKAQWAATGDALGRLFGSTQVPVPDLAGALGLGTLLRPGTHAGVPGARGSSAVVDDLFHAAKSSREAAHALLAHTPPGWKESTLDYLLTTRWRASLYLKDHAPFNDLLITATTGQDPTSRHLAAELTKILSDEVRSAFGKADDGNLKLVNRELFDRYTPLSYPLARAIAANVDELSQLYLNQASFEKVAPADMSYALLLATSNDAGFAALVGAQVEHMRAALDSVPPVGLDASNAERLGFTQADVKHFDFDEDGRVDKADIMQFLTDRTVEEASPFNQIVETRRQILIAQGLDDKKADEALKTMVGNAIGLLPVPGARRVSELAIGAFGDMLSNGYNELAGAGYDQIARQVAQRMSEHRSGLDETYRTLTDDRRAVERLTDQMLATALLNKGILDALETSNQSFRTENFQTIKPFNEMTPREYSEFLEWTRETGGSSDLLNSFRTAFRRTSEVDDYLGLETPSTGDGK
ncbi:hypothetical protein ACBI99_26310 [Nonomuraea sp. ATR24]|uniref:hypothetical protein n=1 Tax=Nonomuraea sp. ATR24 TaxID=1676744 RepID=UPI0035BEF90C